MNNFDLKKFLIENKLTANSKTLNETPDPEFTQKMEKLIGSPAQVRYKVDGTARKKIEAELKSIFDNKNPVDIDVLTEKLPYWFEKYGGYDMADKTGGFYGDGELVIRNKKNQPFSVILSNPYND